MDSDLLTSSDPSEPVVSTPTAVPEVPGRLHDHPAPGVAVPDDEPTPGRPFLFAGEAGTLRGRGARTRVVPRAGEALADAVDRALVQAGPGAVVVGAVGFDDSVPPALVVPATRSWTPGPASQETPAAPTDLPPTAPAALGTRWDSRADPTPAEFATAVARALTMIDEGRVEKVVLSRSGVLTAPSPIDVEDVLSRLVAHDPGAYAFRADISPPDGGDGQDGEPDRDPDERTLLGASPELLLARRGRTVNSNPMAGTAARSLDPDEDARRAARLEASSKDRHEHALVVEQVAERLAPFCSRLHVPTTPELSSTRALWHLSTRIEGELRDDPDTGRVPNSLRLATALHPTAAICGSPTAAAREVIAELEAVPRGYYTGLVGWCDDAGDGEWAVTIRCAQVRGRRARLHAGAGIVAGSSPEAEVAETSTKFRPLLAALGLEATP